MRLSVSTVMLLAAAGTSGYTPEELGRIVAADEQVERDVRRLAAEFSQRKDEDDGHHE